MYYVTVHVLIEMLNLYSYINFVSKHSPDILIVFKYSMSVCMCDIFAV